MPSISPEGDKRAAGIVARLDEVRAQLVGLCQSEAKLAFDHQSFDEALLWLQLLAMLPRDVDVLKGQVPRL